MKDTDRVGFCLGVPEFKREEIKMQFSSETQQRKTFINYFIEHDPEASWRKVICALDRISPVEKEAGLAADNIRHLAEAIPGRVGS